METENTSQNWITEDEVNHFVGENVMYYRNKWSDHLENNLYKGWNLAAFFFFFEWAGYRKMYREAILIYLGLTVVSFFLAFLPGDMDIIWKIVSQLAKIVMGAFANGLYRKKALRTVQQCADMEENEKREYLMKKGGTSVGGVFLMLLIEIILMFFPLLLLLVLALFL